MNTKMRYQEDINTEHNIKPICREALLKDNAPDSKLFRHGFDSSTGEQQLLISTLFYLKTLNY